MLLFCFNKSQWNCLDTFDQVLQLFFYCLIVHTIYSHTTQTTTGPLWGVVFLVSPVGQLCLDQISFGPLPPSKIPPESQHAWYPHQYQELHVLSRFAVIWIECSHTVFPMRTMCTHEMMWRQMHRPTQILNTLGRMSFCCNAKFQYLHGGWFLIVLELHLGGTGASLSTWSPPSMGPCWLTQLTWVRWFMLFDGELGMPSVQLLVRWSTNNASFMCGTGIGSSLDPSPFTEFSLSYCSRL